MKVIEWFKPKVIHVEADRFLTCMFEEDREIKEAFYVSANHLFLGEFAIEELKAMFIKYFLPDIYKRILIEGKDKKEAVANACKEMETSMNTIWKRRTNK